jgi:hypothetical protein
MTSSSTVVSLRQPEEVEDPLTAVLRSGARRLLAQAVEAEAEAFLATMKGARLADGRERLVRHGHGPERLVQTGIGPVEVQRVKVRDRGAGEGGERIRFTSAILPRWARRTRSLDALLPVLYLRGVSMGDFGEALAALLGKDAPNLSPSAIARLRASGRRTTRAGSGATCRPALRLCLGRRRLPAGPHGAAAECMLVLIGATPEGKKELVGFQVGVRESAQSWRDCWSDLKARGLAIAPELATGDGRSASGRRSRRSSLDPAPAVLGAQDRERAEQAAPVRPARRQGRPARDLAGAGPRDGRGGDRHLRREVRGQIRQGGRVPGQGPRGAAGLLRLPGRALGPPAHANPIESVFATVRHRTVRTKGALSQDTARLMVFKLVMAAGQDLAPAEGREPVAQGRPGRHLPRRRRGHRHASADRRLTTASPKFRLALVGWGC